MFKRSAQSKREKRLVGDTAHLRARFREEYPDTPISTERGSAYRAWLNAQRRGARLGRAPASFVARNPRTHRPVSPRNGLVQHAFALGIKRGDVEGTPHGTGLSYDYYGWMRAKGIDPHSGLMTDAGLAFFKQLLDEDRAEKRTARRRPDEYSDDPMPSLPTVPVVLRCRPDHVCFWVVRECPFCSAEHQHFAHVVGSDGSPRLRLGPREALCHRRDELVYHYTLVEENPADTERTLALMDNLAA